MLCEPSELLQCMLAMLCMPSWPLHLPSSIMRIIRRCCHVTALLHHSYACTSSRVAAAQMHPADVNDMAVPPAIILQQVPVAKGLMLWALLSSRVRAHPHSNTGQSAPCVFVGHATTTLHSRVCACSALMGDCCLTTAPSYGQCCALPTSRMDAFYEAAAARAHHVWQ